LSKIPGISVRITPRPNATGLLRTATDVFWYLSRSSDYEWLHHSLFEEESFYEFAKNIVDCVKQHNPTDSAVLKEWEVTNYTIIAAMKIGDRVPDLVRGMLRTLPAVLWWG
jgi:hypothetical protein